MAYMLPVGLGVVAGVFLLIVVGEVFYLFYWRKRPLAYPRGNSVTVAPVNEGEPVAARERGGTAEVLIDVTCAEYQIAALHQDLVEKLFPALGVASTESAQNLMGPTRMLFTITEETKEDLEGLDLDGKGLVRSRRSSRSKSMSDISVTVSPVGPLSPLSSTPFATPQTSPDHFVTPYGTPTYSPLVTMRSSVSAASPVILKTSCRIMYDYTSCSPPPGPPSPTRPSFPFLARAPSPTSSPDLLQETAEWGSPSTSKLPPNNAAAAAATFYSPPRKPFAFATSPIHGNNKQQGEGLVVKAGSPLRACTYVYDNGTFSPTSPTSPQCFPPLLLTAVPHEPPKNQEASNSIHNSPCASPSYSCSSSPAAAGPRTPSFNHSTPPSDTVVSSLHLPPSSTTTTCKPSSQRSSAVLFSSSPSASGLTRPFLSPSNSPSKSFVDTATSPPPNGCSTLSPSWGESMSTPFIVEPSSSSVH